MAQTPGVYLRIDTDGTSDVPIDIEPVQVGDHQDVPCLTFVDMYSNLRMPYSAPYTERLTEAIQDRLHLVLPTDRILFRWPWIAGPDQVTHHIREMDDWLRRLVDTDEGETVIPQHIHVGAIQHRVAGSSFVRWAGEAPEDEMTVLSGARNIELNALLQRSNAIWNPLDYHFRLPSGEHTDIFIRVADAIQSPQDAYALATWLSDRLVSGVGIVVDTGGLTPLLIQLESFLTRFDLTTGITTILSEYPTGRPTIRRTVDNAIGPTTPKIVSILSVSSTGTLLNNLLDELDEAKFTLGIDYTLDVLVDRTPKTRRRSSSADGPNVISWLAYDRSAEVGLSGSCPLCRSPEKAQFVAIDPRTYVTMALPGPYLVMPSNEYATDAQLFWKRVSDSRGVAIETNPHPQSRVARGKRTALPVRLLLDLICQTDGLEALVAERCENLEIPDGFEDTALIVTVARDIDTVPVPSFAGQDEVDLRESLRAVLVGMGIDKETPIVTTDETLSLRREVSELDDSDTVLAFTWGSVTGLTLRHLKVTIAEEVRSQKFNLTVNGLVFHSRPSTPGEWTALQNQFKPGSLVGLWASCFPWTSPMSEEYRLLDRTDFGSFGLSQAAESFLHNRRGFLLLHSTYSEYEDDWSPRFEAGSTAPHPEHIFWGMARDGIHQKRVRGRSLYGQDLDCLSAYTAIGAVVNHTRFTSRPKAAPRWVMFNLGRIVRSYFDAVIMCSILRWLYPGELWWGAEKDDPDSICDSVTFLLEQAEDTAEQVLLVPELLLASAQGKVPTVAHSIVRDRAESLRRAWPTDARFDIPRAAVEVGLALLERSLGGGRSTAQD